MPRLRAVSLFGLAASWLTIAGCHAAPAPVVTITPQQYAWTLLAQASAAAGTGAVGWEGWATPGQVFQPAGRVPVSSEFMPPAAVMVRALVPRPCPPGEYLVAHLNPDEVSYIQNNQLGSVAGLQRWFAQGRSVDFPAAAISLKAVWKVLGAADNPADYVLGTFGGVHYGLQGINLAAKAGPDGASLPQWFWATFENIRNHCYWSSSYRQSDTFGFPDGQNASASLQTLLAQHHLDQSWLNYRLVGVQSDSTVRLGNSVIEANLPTTSSCLACHSEARFNAPGLVLPPLPFTGDAGPLAPITPAQLAGLRQLDFVWAFLCLDSPTATCQSLPDAGSGH